MIPSPMCVKPAELEAQGFCDELESRYYHIEVHDSQVDYFMRRVLNLSCRKQQEGCSKLRGASYFCGGGSKEY
ncbi:hypothetical protein C922_05488 [Plasmodium inui San Antonio 1]|uniref:Uncharacterized protein n=1 Tax=Plasmodium inui San Antonio 1 TaxID=1237626 RepID=W7A4V6_9APIC|nr:hypothetical protein C922_05488 [Plasmodium inui San Antonio 1]EUD64129.1 hypothetical protein C922_05488 [Plasmodium inui San Antonio 1]